MAETPIKATKGKHYEGNKFIETMERRLIHLEPSANVLAYLLAGAEFGLAVPVDLIASAA